MQLQPRWVLKCRHGQSVLHDIVWLVKFAPGLFRASLTRKSHSITLIGSSATMCGMNSRPRLVHGPVVLDLLNNDFCTSTGYNRTLNRSHHQWKSLRTRVSSTFLFATVPGILGMLRFFSNLILRFPFLNLFPSILYRIWCHRYDL